MTNHEVGGGPQDDDFELKRAIAEQVNERLGWLQQAADKIGGEGSVITEVFPEPPEVRDDAEEPNWGEQQIADARDVAHRFGYGAEHTVPSGLVGGRRIIEGGLWWKLLAEDAAADEDGAPAELIFAGSSARELRDNEREVIGLDIADLKKQRDLFDQYSKGTDEENERRAAMTARISDMTQLLEPGATEYDAACVLAMRRASTGPVQSVEVAPFGYEILPGKRARLMHSPSGQLMEIGVTASGQKVRLLRVDREPTAEGFNQPDSAALMSLIAGIADAEGAPNDPVGLITSGTYASRTVDAFRSAQQSGHLHGITMYGRAARAKFNRIPMMDDSPLNQLPGDLWAMHEKLQALKVELGPIDQ